MANYKEMPLIIGGLILIGLLLSIPSCFLMILFIYKIDSLKSVVFKKLIIFFLSLFFASITFLLVFYDDIINHPDNHIQLIFIFSAYAAALLVNIGIYKLNITLT